MFGFIIFIVLIFVGGLFSRPFYGYYRRPRIHRFGGFGGWGWGMGRPYGPMMWHGCPHHHHHHHHHMGHGRRW